ncbi:MAG: FliI/YscN family ATPase [Myxococcales bacterium]|nr:FliI/YscN family ATPase [Myxococcales bacterium]
MFDARTFGVDLGALERRLDRVGAPVQSGKVTQVVGLVIEGFVPGARVGSLCEITTGPHDSVTAEVVGFRERTALMMPLGDVGGVQMGAQVTPRSALAHVSVGPGLLGRVLDGLGRPLDGQPLPDGERDMPLYAEPMNPLQRRPIDEPLWLGIRAIDCLLTCGRGQRVGIFAGSGVGKSVTMGMIARNATSDINVIALVGERGREVLSFIQRDLGPEGLKRSVVVAATSDTAPLVRIRAAYLATTIAEYFRSCGKNVLLMMDSVTRFAMAQREVGLAAGEPPTTRGYTPSVFALLPRLLERAGTCDGPGSITGLYTVLVEGDDLNDPIGDSVRSIIDGHVVLSRDLASRNHYPAIDVLVSASRVMGDVTSDAHRQNAGTLRELLAAYRKAEDLINIGAYQRGANATIDRAVAQIDAIDGLLRQAQHEHIDPKRSLEQMAGIVRAGGGPR